MRQHLYRESIIQCPNVTGNEWIYPVCLSVFLFVGLSACLALSFYLSIVCLSVRPSVCRSIRLSFYLSICLSICPSVCLLPFSLSVHLFDSLSVFLTAFHSSVNQTCLHNLHNSFSFHLFNWSYPHPAFATVSLSSADDSISSINRVPVEHTPISEALHTLPRSTIHVLTYIQCHTHTSNATTGLLTTESLADAGPVLAAFTQQPHSQCSKQPENPPIERQATTRRKKSLTCHHWLLLRRPRVVW